MLCGPIAQLAEPPAHNRSVPGSIPGGPMHHLFDVSPAEKNFSSSTKSENYPLNFGQKLLAVEKKVRIRKRFTFYCMAWN
jgi:hypothetical protein